MIGSDDREEEEGCRLRDASVLESAAGGSTAAGKLCKAKILHVIW